MNYPDRIIQDPQVSCGQPVFKGTRVLLRSVLAGLGSRGNQRVILAGYPSLTPEDVQAAIALAVRSAEEDLPVPATPHVR
jgi:uncharacterized protein (DUF433 family)